MPLTRQRARMAEKEEQLDDVVFVKEADASPPSGMEILRKNLRQRWELASVLNFLNVFEPVIQTKLNISAEEIEAALIEPNDSLAKLHIGLLKGIVPSSKTLNVSDGWMSILSKKLSMWWPWVAEGDFPLTAAKGEEMNRYKELDPTIRLSILKALCEIRADQDDIVIYINDAIKSGTGLSAFQKEKLGEDKKGTLYWHDGNAVIGHRLYKEVQVFEHKPKFKGKRDKLGITSQWETLATNFEEFREVVSQLSSSKVRLEVSVAKVVEANVMPAVERLKKKNERELKQLERNKGLLNDLRTSAITRSSCYQRPVNYRFEEYDRAIKEAIDIAQKKNTTERQWSGGKHDECGKKDQNISVDGSNPALPRESESAVTDTCKDNERHQRISDDQNAKDVCEDVCDGSDKKLNNLDEEIGHKRKLCPVFQNMDGWLCRKPNASHSIKKPSGDTDMHVSESTSITKKHILRQRPTMNTAAQSSIVHDSEDEKSPKDTKKRVRIC